MAGLGAAVGDGRSAGQDLYPHVEPGYYWEPMVVGVLGRTVVVVPVQGPNTVVVAAVETNVFHVHPFGRLELYGVHVTNTSNDYPPVYVKPGAWFKAEDSTFTSPSWVTSDNARVEVNSCSFVDGGLVLQGGHGAVSGSSFANAILSVEGNSPVVVNGVSFEG